MLYAAILSNEATAQDCMHSLAIYALIQANVMTASPTSSPVARILRHAEPQPAFEHICGHPSTTHMKHAQTMRRHAYWLTCKLSSSQVYRLTGR